MARTQLEIEMFSVRVTYIVTPQATGRHGPCLCPAVLAHLPGQRLSSEGSRVKHFPVSCKAILAGVRVSAQVVGKMTISCLFRDAK